MPLLDECPYYVQALFWMALFSLGGWGFGLARAQINLARRRSETQRR